MDNPKMQAFYRCRLCGEMYAADANSNRIYATMLRVVPYAYPGDILPEIRQAEPLDIVIKHACSNTAVGVADFVGIGEKDSNA